MQAIAEPSSTLERLTQLTALDDLLSLLGETLSPCEAFDGFLINLLDHNESHLVCRWTQLPERYAGVEKIYKEFRFPIEGDDPIAVAFKQQRIIKVDSTSIAQTEGVTRTAFERWAACELIVIPLIDNGEAFGALLGFKQSPLDPEQLTQVEQRLPLFSPRLHHALRYDQLIANRAAVAAALDEKREFVEFVGKLNELLSVDQIYREVAIKFLHKYGFDIASFSLASSESLVLERVTCSRKNHQALCLRMEELFAGKPAPLKHSEGASVFAFMQNTLIHVPDALVLADLPMAPRDRQALDCLQSVRTVLHVPIRRHEQPIGMLGLYSLGEPITLNEAELNLIELVSTFLGAAISNARLHQLADTQKSEIEALNQELRGKVERLNELVAKDQLTGLNNFGAFENELERRTSEYSRRSGEGLSLVVLDVDHFKHFNDTYGHVAGNFVLQEVARRIRRRSRQMDIPCRYGGEEFVVILPKCELESAGKIAEEIRRAIADEPFFTEDQVVSVTISAGCASYRYGEDAQAFIARADTALYAAKKAGRNRVELAMA